MERTMPARDDYALGYSDDEQRRLDRQGAFLRPASERWLREAGIEPGMRVLDVGCGTGDLSRLAASLAGPAGRVVGIDRSPEVIATARRAAEARKLATIDFVEADIADFTADEPFDALIGRLVLLYQTNPAATLRRLAKFVRPGGIVAFSDYYLSYPAPMPPQPLVSQCLSWIVSTLRRAVPNADLGARLHVIYEEAGLPAPIVRFESLAEIGGDPVFVDMVVDTLRSLLPVAEQFGVVSAAEAGIGSLHVRLMAEATAANGVVFAPVFATAAARLPSP